MMIMNKLLNKISEYNLFNHLLPGIIFVVILEYLTAYSLPQKNLIISAFVYYFIGLVISRIGSLIIEPTLKRIGFLNFATYTDFVQASKTDEKIEVLSEDNNMYRTFIATLTTLLSLRVCEIFINRFTFLSIYRWEILLIVLLILFLFAYKKQTEYIKKRVEKGLKKN